MPPKQLFFPAVLLLALTGLPGVSMAAPPPAGAAAAAPPTADRYAANPVFKRLGQLAWVPQGKGTRVVYAFMDPNCPYCHLLYERFQGLVGPANIQVRWIPVGILTATSEGKAAAILGAQDPVAAFRRNEAGFSRSGGGGIAEGIPDDATLAKLRANVAEYHATGVSGVPAVIILDHNGRAGVVQGAPDTAQLRELLKRAR